MKKIIPILIVILFSLSILVIAKGGSSGGYIKKETPVEVARPDCESFSLIIERIKCRLEFGQKYETTPEPCRNLNSPVNNEQGCTKLYKDSLPCYELSGTNKDQCFKNLAGFSKTTVREEISTPDGNKKVRLYLVALLYDLEEIVEDAQREEKMDLDLAAELIDSIVVVKSKVLQNKPVSEVRASLKNLKDKWPKELK